MKIISEKTGKTYGSVEECVADEKRFDEAIVAKENKKKEMAEARKSRAMEVENAYKKVLEAQKEYHDKLNKFIEDYGSFHMTIKDHVPFEDIFDWLF